VVWAGARVIGLSDADFWGMTPRSYAAVQDAYSRLHGGEPDADKAALNEGKALLANFTALSAQQKRKAADG
jgi:hypothetical protein